MKKAGVSLDAFFYPAAIIIAVILLFASQIGVASAAISSNVTAGLVTSGQKIKASSATTSVIGFNLVSSAETLASIRFSINAGAGFAAATDLPALSISTSSGIALYRDDNSSGTQGTFDAADDVVPLASVPEWTGATTTFTVAAVETVPADDAGANAGNDYFLVIQTAAAAVNGHTVSFNVYPGEIAYSANTPTGSPTALTTSVVTLDTTVPTVLSTGPTTGATGVPVSTFINASFSENMDSSTMNSTNITLTTGGSPVGASINTWPQGFNMVVSNPPTYADGARFAKIAGTATGFFMFMNG